MTIEYRDIVGPASTSVASGIDPDANNNSPYLIGFWPLRDQKLAVIRDVGPKRNHVTINGGGGSRFTRYTADANGWFQHATAAAGPSSGRMNIDPNDALYDLTGPNQSFIVNFEVKIDVAPNSYNQIVLAKGGSSGSGGRRTLLIGALDNATTSHHIWLNDNNTGGNKLSSALNTGQVYNVTIFRDGIAGKLYVYLNGALDAGFNGGLGYLAFAPTLSDERYITALFGSGFNTDNPVTSSYNGVSAANSYKFRNLSLYITPPGVQLTNMAAIAAILAANPTHILTYEELV